MASLQQLPSSNSNHEVRYLRYCYGLGRRLCPCPNRKWYNLCLLAIIALGAIKIYVTREYYIFSIICLELNEPHLIDVEILPTNGRTLSCILYIVL